MKLSDLRLADLEPQFLTYIGDGRRKHVDTLAEAQGIFFLCPVHAPQIYTGPNGGHGVEVTFAGRGVSDAEGSHDFDGNPSRWQVAGTDYEDLTLAPSIDISRGGGCTWHGYITSGRMS